MLALLGVLWVGPVLAEPPESVTADEAKRAQAELDEAQPAEPVFRGRPTPKDAMATGAPEVAASSQGSPTAEQIRASLEEQLVAGAVRPRIDLFIAFDYNSAELSDAGRRDLDEAGRALVDHFSDRRFVLAGHTDQSGPSDYNQDLSERRADAARRYLLDHYQIDPERLQAKGYGETEPIPGAEAQRNRRVVLELLR